jgi:hypothetical protein
LNKELAVTAHDSILDLKKRIGKTVLGQEAMIERLLIGLLANGISSSKASLAWPRPGLSRS